MKTSDLAMILTLIVSLNGIVLVFDKWSLEKENARLISENVGLKIKIKRQEILDSSKGLDEFEALVMSVIEVESGGNANAVNGTSNGLMQINGGSFDADANIISGSKMLANLIAKSANNATVATNSEQILHRALTAYNRGWKGSNRYKAKYGTFSSDYSKKVLENYKQIKEKLN